MKNIYCGTITFQYKKIAIYLNIDTFKKEFFEVKDNCLHNLDLDSYFKLDKLYNTPIEAFFLRNSVKAKIAAIILASTLVSNANAANIGSVKMPEDYPIESTMEVDKVEYEDIIKYFKEKGLFYKTNISDFVTRADVCAILYNIQRNPNIKDQEQSIFTDIDGHINEAAIRFASEKKIVFGYDNKFMPDRPITGEEFVTILYRYMSNTSFQVLNDSALYSDLNISEYAKKAVGWALKNNLIEEDMNLKQIVSEEVFIRIIYKLIIKYDLFDEHIGYSKDAADFLDTLNNNHMVGQQIKQPFETLAKIINDYDFKPETLARINNTFGKMMSAESNDKFNSASGTYYPTSNRIIFNRADSHTIIHEGVHAFTSDYEATGLVGFTDIETRYGIGLTEGLTNVVTEEYLDDETDIARASYFHIHTMSQLLLEATDGEAILNYFVNADLPGLLEYLTNIYSKEMTREEAYTAALSLVGRFDTLELYDTNKLDVDEAYLKETISEIEKLFYLNKGIEANTSPAFLEFKNKIMTRNEYMYYYVNKYYFNKKYNNRGFISASKINIEKALSYEQIAASYSIAGSENTVSYILSAYPEVVEQELYQLNTNLDNSIER